MLKFKGCEIFSICRLFHNDIIKETVITLKSSTECILYFDILRTDSFRTTIKKHHVGKLHDLISANNIPRQRDKKFMLQTFASMLMMLSDLFIVGFEVLTAVSMKIAVVWVVAPCSLEIGRAHV
jgi:hypothetical protein